MIYFQMFCTTDLKHISFVKIALFTEQMCFLKAFALIATSRFELKKNVSKVSEKKAIAWKKYVQGEKKIITDIGGVL